MILTGYLRKEVVKTALSILLVLILIFTLQRFVYYIGDAAAGQLSTALIGQLLLLQIPRIFALLLPLSLFLGAMIALGRMYADQEITVMRACGIGQNSIVKSLWRPAFIFMLFSLILALWITPWAGEQQYLLLDKQAAEKQVTLLIPGRFQQSSDGRSIIYVQNQQSEGILDNIFMARKDASQSNNVRVIVATSGQITVGADDDKYISLVEGKRFSGEPGRADFEIASFDKYIARFQEGNHEKERRKVDAVKTSELLINADPASQAEFQWRISTGLSTIILLMLAVPLSRVKPRQGKFAKIGPGLLIYIGYLLLMILSKNWLENERIPSFIGLWWVHLVMILLVFWELDFFKGAINKNGSKKSSKS
jgi:lipopolysaccharide export system permease protein